jgi:hypothetical protein
METACITPRAPSHCVLPGRGEGIGPHVEEGRYKNKFCYCLMGTMFLFRMKKRFWKQAVKEVKVTQPEDILNATEITLKMV